MSILTFTGVRMEEQHLDKLSLPDLDKSYYLALGREGYTSRMDRCLDNMEVDLYNEKELNRIFHTHITSPHDFDGRARHGDNWVRQTCLMADFDGVPVASGVALLDELDCDYVIKYSCGHRVRQIEKGDRWHAIIPLDEPITTKEQFLLAVNFMKGRFGEKQDASCKDMGRNLFPGNRKYPVKAVVGFGPLSTERVLAEGARYIPPKPKAEVIKHGWNLKLVAGPGSKVRNTFLLDQVVETKDFGDITIREAINKGVDNIVCGCPVCMHSDERANKGVPNAHIFIPDNSNDGWWALHCSSCGSRNKANGGDGMYNIEREIEGGKEPSLYFYNTTAGGKLYKRFLSAAGGYVVAKTENTTRINEYLNRGIKPPAVLPEYEVLFKFDSDVVINEDKGYINNFTANDILKTPADHSLTGPPVEFDQVLRWAMGEGCGAEDFEESVKWFYDWLAHIVQRREKNLTAWHFQGISGTGKGIVYECIKAIFGVYHCPTMKQDRLFSNFNELFSKSCFILVDEVNFRLDTTTRLSDAVKLMLTETDGIAESKGVDARIVKKQASFFFFSNTIGALCLPSNDRRFNVAYRQEQAITTTDFAKAVVASGMTWHHWVNNVLVSKEILGKLVAWLKTICLEGNEANTINLRNGAWNLAVHQGRTGVKGMWEAIRDGDYQYFSNRIDSSVITEGLSCERLLASLKQELEYGCVSASTAVSCYNLLFVPEGKPWFKRLPTSIHDIAENEVNLYYNKKKGGWMKPR